MPRVYVGTSGWSYPTGFGKWRGIVYPRGWSGDELTYYAERFPAVEVNVSFYRIPTPAMVRAWVARTSPGFRFAVKLYRKFTHPDFYAREEGRSPEITREDLAGMRRALDLLAEAERLGPVLVQYPAQFRQTEKAIAAMVRTLGTFRAYPLCVELRHRSWDNPRTREILHAVNAARARVDCPVYANLEEVAVDDAAFGYWRLHGRNAAAWADPGAGHRRYDYLYDPREIDDIAQAIRARDLPRRDAYVFCNNHLHGSAVANAVELAAKLDLPLPFQTLAHLTERFPHLYPITGGVGGQMRLLHEGEMLPPSHHTNRVAPGADQCNPENLSH